MDVLLRALAQLPAVRGVVVGGHPAERDLLRLQALAARAGHRRTACASRGSCIGPKSPGLLEQADVLVMPHTATPVSERYASPLKLFEYMASGKPIVASDLSAVREVLRDGENACLVQRGRSRGAGSGDREGARRPLVR